MKLLNKSIRSYLLYAVLILLVAIPVFYLVIQRIVREDVDESLLADKARLAAKLEKIIDSNYIDFLTAFEPDLSISPSATIMLGDSLYSIAVFDSTSSEYIPYRVLQSKLLVKKKPYTIRLKSSMLDSEDLIQSIVAVIGILLLLIVVGLIIINRIIAKKIWSPFYHTLEKIQGHRIDKDESIKFGKTPIDEFNQLNNSLTSLTERNQQVYQSQKEFTENASHEMQTPLAIFQNKLELLMQTTPLSIEQASYMEDMSNASQRMNRLNKILLLLSKIDNNQFLDIEKIAIKELIEKLLEQYKFQAEQKNLHIQFTAVNDMYVMADKTLLETMLGNLLSNAIRHNILNGEIAIILTEQQVVIENTGREDGLNTDKLFKRFQKQTNDNSSTGLGLEIAKRIADLYHFEITYQFFNGRHRFSISY